MLKTYITKYVVDFRQQPDGAKRAKVPAGTVFNGWIDGAWAWVDRDDPNPWGGKCFEAAAVRLAEPTPIPGPEPNPDFISITINVEGYKEITAVLEPL